MTRRAGDEKEDSTMWKVTSQDIFVACEIVAMRCGVQIRTFKG